jgi:hypothetical protein
MPEAIALFDDGRSQTGASGRTGLLFLIVLIAPAAARAQVEAGIVGGFAFAGRQDLTIERRSSPEGSVMFVTREPNLPVDGGNAWGLTFTRWTRAHPSLGLSVDALCWTDSLTMTGLDPAHTPRVLRQRRMGVFPSLTGRLPLDARREIFLYGALGGGVVDSRLMGGDQRIGEAFSIASGLSFPVAGSKLFARIEVRYLITHDFDSDDSKDQNLEFSGSRSWITERRLFGPHQDTRFFPVLLGLAWRF